MSTYFPDRICDGANYAIAYVIEQIFRALTDDPELALSSRFSPTRNKYALAVDEDAEQNFRREFKSWNRAMFQDVIVCGEESITMDSNFTAKNNLVALVDMVDGTDLLERNLSNWCSAAVFFYPTRPKGKRIAAACVGVPSGKIYFAHEQLEGVRYEQIDRHKMEKSPRSGTVKGRSSVTKLENASICFYGQKPHSLLSMAETQLFSYLTEKEKIREDKRTKGNKPNSVIVEKNKENRIYTLSGIPMMMKLIDRQVECAANVDVVVQLGGQHPHDAVPGLYIARKGGAFILNLKTGKEMTDQELDEGLVRPGHPEEAMKYVVASTSDLCFEIEPLLKRKESKAAVAGFRKN